MRLEEIIQDNFIVFLVVFFTSETLIIKTLSSQVQNSLQKKQNEFPRIILDSPNLSVKSEGWALDRMSNPTSSKVPMATNCIWGPSPVGGGKRMD
jgi:hypothetical protein